MKISDSSAESSLRCDARRKRPIPNPLDSSLHQQLCSEHCRFTWLGHRFRRTAYDQRCLPTKGYSHTSAEASRILRLRASAFWPMVLKRKKEALEEIRGTWASRDFSARNQNLWMLPERLRRSAARSSYDAGATGRVYPLVVVTINR